MAWIFANEVNTLLATARAAGTGQQTVPVSSLKLITLVGITPGDSFDWVGEEDITFTTAAAQVCCRKGGLPGGAAFFVGRDGSGYDVHVPLAAWAMLCAAVSPVAALGGEVAGTIRDAAGGEPLARVRVVLACGGRESERLTGADGGFRFEDWKGAECLLHAALVGYRPARLELHGETEIDLALTPDSFARRESVEVAAGPFEVSGQASASERSLTGAEIRNLAAVLIDDPLRAAQALPGVASSNDYAAQFAVRGAAFQRTGVYLDGVLLHNPFHSVQSQEETGSLSIVNADLVEELVLHAGAPPAAYGDRTAGALDLRLREGSRQGPSFRMTAGVASSGVSAEGPLGKAGRGSWLAAARKSYLQYLLRRSSAADTLAFGFLDAEGRLAYDVDERNQVTLSFLDGKSDLDRTHVRNRLGINAVMTASYHTSLLNVGWRYAPSSSALVTARAAWMRERADNRNNRELGLGGAGYGEWIGSTSLLCNWSRRAPLEAGFAMRRIHDDGYSARYNFNPLALRRRDNWHGTEQRPGGYVEQAWTAGAVRLSAGARFDGYSAGGEAAVSPHASATLRLTSSTRLQMAWSQAVQYPSLALLLIENTGNRGLAAERASHAVAALERSLGSRTRVRAEVYYRADRDLIAQPLLEPRLLEGGAIFVPPAVARFENSVRGTAHGFEVFVQRRTANRVSGWISYGYVKTAMRDGVTGAAYAADAEQRHTVSAYGSYRLKPTVNVSARYSYGSNFPVPGFLRRDGDLYYLSTQRNAVRLPDYHRADVRVNKSFHHETARGWTWRGVLYAEVMNLTNRRNVTYDSFNGFNARTGQAFPGFLKLFPIVPAAGLMIEWDRSVRGR